MQKINFHLNLWLQTSFCKTKKEKLIKERGLNQNAVSSSIVSMSGIQKIFMLYYL